MSSFFPPRHRLKGAVIGIDDEDESTFTIRCDQKIFHFQVMPEPTLANVVTSELVIVWLNDRLIDWLTDWLIGLLD